MSPTSLARRGAVVAALASLALAGSAAAQPPGLLVAEVRGIITPVVSEYLREAVDRAEREGHVALLVELDTPGGLDASMREIVQAFLGARVPVIVYVAPPGARAASAGALITMAAHVAAMAPGTVIGAATPVDLEGGDVARKVINDAAAYAVSIARERGRDETFAEEAVREGRSVTADEAREVGAIDLIAGSRGELLDAVDGRAIRLAEGRTVELRTRGVPLVEHRMGFSQRVLQWLADPNLAFLFLSLGTLAIIYEIANPGVGLGGIAGAILLLLAFASLSVLPVNVVGVLLLVLALGLFIAELFVPGVGVFAAGGTISLVLGGLFLFRGSLGIDPVVLLPSGVVAGGGALLLGRAAWRSRRLPPATGAEALIGRRTEVRSVQGDRAEVFLDGTWWGARPRAGRLEVGQSVRVAAVEGLTLVVEPEEGEP
jgi:membrane-bound serine protease (ClpP class)